MTVWCATNRKPQISDTTKQPSSRGKKVGPARASESVGHFPGPRDFQNSEKCPRRPNKGIRLGFLERGTRWRQSTSCLDVLLVVHRSLFTSRCTCFCRLCSLSMSILSAIPRIICAPPLSCFFFAHRSVSRMTKRGKPPGHFPSPSHHRRGHDHELGTSILHAVLHSLVLTTPLTRRNTGIPRVGRIGITQRRRRAFGKNLKVSCLACLFLSYPDPTL